MTSKDFRKLRISFHTDEGKFNGMIDDEASDTIHETYGEELEKLENEGFDSRWQIEPISQEPDPEWAKARYDYDDDDELLSHYYKVEADLVLLSKELIEKLKGELDKKRTGDETKEDQILNLNFEWLLLLRPYVEEALGRTWTCPPLLRNDQYRKWQEIVKNS